MRPQLVLILVLLAILRCSVGRCDEVRKWAVHEIMFTASKTLDWKTFPLEVTFQNGPTRKTVDGFWDGDRQWRVRFAPPEEGIWTWSTSSTDSGLAGKSGEFTCVVPSPTEIERNPNLHGHLRIGDDRHYFVYADGTPFLYLGDTCWHVNDERCGLGNNEDGPFYVWMADRKSKGFSVINHWFYAYGQGQQDNDIPSENEGGRAFRRDNDGCVFDEIRPRYFQCVDLRWQALWSNGFVMAGPPTWIGRPDHHMTLEQAKDFSRYLMARYGAFNLVWALSGEYSLGKRWHHPPWDEPAAWNELGNFVASHNPFHHPISIHPGPAEFHASSSIDFHNERWLDHNWLQTGQRQTGLYRVAEWASADYNRKPTRPVLHTEGWYEGLAVSAAADSYSAGWQFWVAYLNGACGAVYGAGGVWNFYDPSDPRSYFYKGQEVPAWPDALKLRGSERVKHVGDFFRSIEWWKLVPHREWLLVNGEPAPMPTEEDITPPHCAGEIGRSCVIYIPSGSEGKAITLTRVPGNPCSAKWFDPRHGTYADIGTGTIKTNAEGQWTIPERPDSRDWVVYLESVP